VVATSPYVAQFKCREYDKAFFENKGA